MSNDGPGRGDHTMSHENQHEPLSFPTRGRRFLASRLRSWAQSLDPIPTVTRADGGGWLISGGGVPIAHVSPGVTASRNSLWGAEVTR